MYSNWFENRVRHMKNPTVQIDMRFQLMVKYNKYLAITNSEGIRGIAVHETAPISA